MRIQDLIVTPIAFRDPALLNAVGVHEPLALRTVVQLVVEGGVVGLGEGSGEAPVIERLRAVRDAIIGFSVFDLNGIERAIHNALDAVDGRPSISSLAGGSGYASQLKMTPSSDPGRGVDHASPPRDEVERVIQRRVVFSMIDVACHDAQGQLTGQPVHALLGGAVRERVDFSAYLFYKWAAHPGEPADRWGAALDAAGMVEQARFFIDTYGFGSLKLKGGVLTPDEEVATIRALKEEFPGHPLRIDPNGAWTVETSKRVAAELAGDLEYLEDPCLGQPGMAEVAATTTIPLATNMCVVAFEHIREAVLTNSVQIILSDHHYWGGLRHTRELGAICQSLGLGMSMHSNSHLGISLAAMTHVAAASPNLSYACDTHYPWNSDDEIITTPFVFEGGSLPVSNAPGLGVQLNEHALATLHDQYVASGRTVRDDSSYMQRFEPDYNPNLPRF